MSLKRRKAEKAPDKDRPQSGVTALIDMDVVVYSCGFAAQKNIHEVTINGEDKPRASFNYKKELKEWVKQNDLSDCDYSVHTVVEADSVENTLHSVKVFLNGILEATNAQYYKGYLTGANNFRYDVSTLTEYKAGRPPKPVHYQTIRDYLVNVWSATVVDGCEADDFLAMELTKDPKNNVLCSIDKDLLQVKGNHYQWNKPEKGVFWVDDQQGVINLYQQAITGDITDCILGLSEKRPRKRTFSTTPVTWLKTECDMYEYVMEGYVEKYGEEKAKEALQENMHLLFMIREKDNLGGLVHWTPPK